MHFYDFTTPPLPDAVDADRAYRMRAWSSSGHGTGGSSIQFPQGTAGLDRGAWFCDFVAARNTMSKIGGPVLGFLVPVLGVIVTLVVAFMKQKDTV